MNDKRRDDDLDWLYGRSRPRDESEDATQVFEAQGGQGSQGTANGGRADQGQADHRPSESIYRPQSVPANPQPRRDPAPTAQMPVWQDGPQQARPQQPYQQPAQQLDSSRGGSGGGSYGRPSGPPPGGVRPGQAPAAPSGRPRRKLHPIRWLLVLLLLYVVFLVATPLWFFTRGNTVDAASPAPLADQPGEVILLVGSDARTNLSDAQKRKYGTGSAEGARTDTIMLLFLPKKGKPSLISLPRDLRVTVPGHGHDKLNAAFAYGGPKLLTQTIETSTGVQVDGYLQIGMVGFAEAVDAVGGISMCLDKAMVDKDSHANFKAGCQDFDGRDALAYVRMRKADPTGDLGRTKRQREVIGKITKKAIGPSTLLPWRYWALNKVASQLLVRGTNTSLTTEARAMMAFLSISKGDGNQFVIPIGNPAASYGGVSYVTWNKEKVGALFDSMKQGSSEGFEQYQR